MPKSRFYQQLFESINLQVALDQQAFEPAIRALTLLKASSLIDRHAAIDAAPAIEGGRADAILAADGADCEDNITICDSSNRMIAAPVWRQ